MFDLCQKAAIFKNDGHFESLLDQRAFWKSTSIWTIAKPVHYTTWNVYYIEWKPTKKQNYTHRLR